MAAMGAANDQALAWLERFDPKGDPQ
jgi:hypothetical protein